MSARKAKKSTNYVEIDSDDENDAPRTPRARRCKSLRLPEPVLPDIQDEKNDDDFILKPTALVNEECSFSGNQVFKFNTPKKKGGMLEKAINSPRTPRSSNLLKQPTTPRTPRGSNLLKQPTTPRTPRGSNLLMEPMSPRTPRGSALKSKNISPETPKSNIKGTPRLKDRKGNGTPYPKFGTPSRKNRLSILANEAAPVTPKDIRKNVRKRIQRVAMDEDSSSSDEEIFDSDDEPEYKPDDSGSEQEEEFDEEEEEEKSTSEEDSPNKENFLQKKLPTVKPGRKRKQKNTEDVVANSIDYFNNNFSKVVTSDHTLNRLDTPRLSSHAVQKLLSNMEDIHSEEKELLFHDHIRSFPNWMTILIEGYSLFFHGVGSKKGIIGLFQDHYLSNYDHVVVNGFFPSLTLKSILSTIIDDILESKQNSQVVQDNVDFISKHYTTTSDPLFLIIHNIDGPMLRGEKTQQVLSQLASVPNIHVIASIDHINAPLILDGTKMGSYNPIWWDVTTLAPYIEETSYENSLLVQQSGALALSSLVHLFASLTPNTKKIFMVIVMQQLANSDNSNYTGISFPDLYHQCREEFLVNSDLTLRAQLTEFHDHKLIKTKKGADGLENFIISLDNASLEEFVNDYGDTIDG